MDDLTRREFIGTVTGAAAAAFVPPGGFRGTLCFFSKHLPDLDGRGLARALKPLGFAGIDLTVRPKGHVEPDRVAQLLPVFVNAIRAEGLDVPFITTELTSTADPAAKPTLETAKALNIRLFKPGYYHYAFNDVRKE